MNKIICGLLLCAISLSAGAAFASDEEPDFVPRSRFTVINPELKPEDFYKALKPYLVRHGEENPLLENLDDVGRASLNAHLEKFWPFRCCAGVDGLSLLLTANHTGLKLDRGFYSQWMALRVWARSPGFETYRKTRYLLPFFSIALSFPTLLFTATIHAPEDASTVMYLGYENATGLLNWANKLGIGTQPKTSAIKNILITSFNIECFALSFVPSHYMMLADNGQQNVKDILHHIRTEDGFYKRNGMLASFLWGVTLVKTAKWNWNELFIALTGNLVNYIQMNTFCGEKVAREVMKNATKCYLYLDGLKYIPCNTTLPAEYEPKSFVFKFTTYLSEATVYDVLPWMIPHFLNLLWFCFTILRL